MAVLVLVSGLILDQINTNRRLMARNLHQQEVLSVATMAVQTKQDQLTLNGITVTVKRSQQGSCFYPLGMSSSPIGDCWFSSSLSRTDYSIGEQC